MTIPLSRPWAGPTTRSDPCKSKAEGKYQALFVLLFLFPSKFPCIFKVFVFLFLCFYTFIKNFKQLSVSFSPLQNLITVNIIDWDGFLVTE